MSRGFVRKCLKVFGWLFLIGALIALIGGIAMAIFSNISGAEEDMLRKAANRMAKFHYVGMGLYYFFQLFFYSLIAHALAHLLDDKNV